MQSLLVVGGSLAGLSAVRAARALGFTGRVTVLGAESHRPYDRPPLSKELLAGTMTEADVALETDGEDLDVDWQLGTTAESLDPDELAVTTTDGDRHNADGIVLATGGFPVVPPQLATAAAGSAPTNLTALRTVEDARWLRARLTPGAKVVVVGAGLIGSEVAATAVGLGCEVDILDLAENPLARLYGDQLGRSLSEPHHRHGVGLYYGRQVTEIDTAGDWIEALRLDDGTRLSADVVLVAIGARPQVAWLADSGLTVGDGVVCDAAGRTNRFGIVAVGDCAAWWDRHLQRPHRSQHWTDALERPALAVASLLGIEPPARKPSLPYFWSDQYGMKIQLAGYASLADEVEVVSGDPGSGPCLALYRRDGEPVAVLGVSSPREFVRWRKTIAAALADVETPTAPSPIAAPAFAAPHPTA